MTFWNWLMVIGTVGALGGVVLAMLLVARGRKS